MVRRRRELAAAYQELLADVPCLRTVRDPEWGASNFQSFWVELDEGFPLGRNDLLASLAEQGVSARAGIMAAHRQPAWAGHPHGDLSITERLTDNTLILPLFHTMTDAEQERVVAGIRGAAGLRAA
jgi:dTDP-4-amino-4,6-dideoxygalactose transaminase